MADFNGDARADVFVYDPASGRWTLMLSGADGPTFERGNWGSGWDVSTARLNDDGQADLFLWECGIGPVERMHPRRRRRPFVWFLRRVGCRWTYLSARPRR